MSFTPGPQIVVETRGGTVVAVYSAAINLAAELCAYVFHVGRYASSA